MNRTELKKHLSATKKLIKEALAEDVPRTLEMICSVFGQHANQKKSVKLAQTSESGGWGDKIVAGHYMAALLLCDPGASIGIIDCTVNGESYLVTLGLPMQVDNEVVFVAQLTTPQQTVPAAAAPVQPDDDEEELDEDDELDEDEEWGDEEEEDDEDEEEEEVSSTT